MFWGAACDRWFSAAAPNPGNDTYRNEEGKYLVLEHGRGVSDTSNDTDTAGIGDSGSELGAGSNVHTSEGDGVLDVEHPREVGGDGCITFTSVTIS